VLEDEECMDVKQEVEERIADFFEARPYFYDLSHDKYKNRKLRDYELAQFAKSLGRKWDGKLNI